MLNQGSPYINLGGIRGASTIEYVVLICLLVAALVGMQIYLRRAVCGKWRETADIFGSGRQYEPGLTTKDGGTF